MNHYTITAPDGSCINTKDFVKDLGITLSRDGTFGIHINNVGHRAQNQAGWIMQTFRSREKVSMLTLYKSLVRPLLEYCCQLWCPWKVGERQTLEVVQRLFTNKIIAVTCLDYWERLKILKLFSLERRRERYAILYIYKILMGQTVNNLNIRSQNHQRLGRVHRRAATRVKTLEENAFVIRGPLLFNSLPRYLRDSTDLSLEKFKNELDRFLWTLPDQPKLPLYYLRAASNSTIDQLAQKWADEKY